MMPITLGYLKVCASTKLSQRVTEEVVFWTEGVQNA